LLIRCLHVIEKSKKMRYDTLYNILAMEGLNISN
jgi:hypothetical protein